MADALCDCGRPRGTCPYIDCEHKPGAEPFYGTEVSDWRCECGDLNRDHEAFCFRCGAGKPDDA